MTLPSLRSILLSALVLVPISFALARGGPENHLRKMEEELGLSADQSSKVEDIFYRHGQSKVDIRARIERAELELKHQLSLPNTDEKAAYKALDAMEDARRDGAHDKLAMALELKKVLTPEQWEKAQELREEHRRGPSEEEHEGRRHHDGPEDRFEGEEDENH